MEALVVLSLVVVVLVVVDVLALRVGVDSRHETLDPRAPQGGLSV